MFSQKIIIQKGLHKGCKPDKTGSLSHLHGHRNGRYQHFYVSFSPQTLEQPARQKACSTDASLVGFLISYCAKYSQWMMGLVCKKPPFAPGLFYRRSEEFSLVVCFYKRRCFDSSKYCKQICISFSINGAFTEIRVPRTNNLALVPNVFLLYF